MVSVVKEFLKVAVVATILVWNAKGKNLISKPKCHESIGQASLEYLSSKRPYFYNASLELQHEFTPKGCTPAKFWFFGRHGTRNPGGADIVLMQTEIPAMHKEILEAIEAGQDELCPKSRREFSLWLPRPGFNVSVKSFLVAQGRRELREIGERYKNRFPNLFPTRFDNSSYFFKHTDSQRTEASAKSFVEGIFGIEGSKGVWMPPPEKPDPILKFYDACPKWHTEVNDNPEANVESELFIKSEPMLRTISKVSRRIGLQRNITFEEIKIAFKTCAFETAWENGTISPWCVIFDLEDFKVMSFMHDLEYYWKDGYGFEINYKQACVPFKDAVEYFEKFGKNPGVSERKVQAFFSHAGAILKMLARLGLFPSKRLTSSGFEDEKDSYKWRSSRIATMASHMAFTLFTCEVDGITHQKIGYYFQEIPQPILACNGKTFCNYEEFHRNLAPIVKDCNLTKICKV